MTVQHTILALLSVFLLPSDAPSPDRFMEEICNNALDDDADGLIDLNDPDCDCPVLEPVSLIPNPSFEEHHCCPSGNRQLECADTWIQASEATTDYFHRCGYFDREEFPVPLPIPDGDAYIGFRNGRFSENGTNPNWKEYTGACLLSPLKAGTSYTFQFYIGFTNAENSPPMNVVFYGSTSCDNLPFGSGNDEFGCPLNGPGWVEMGRAPVSGNNSWRQYEITVTPAADFTAMAIGPDCIELSRSSHTYYFLDNLILADTKSFEAKISSSGHPCTEVYTLRFPPETGASYQWYRDGVAIVGAVEPALIAGAVGGVYQLLLTTATECRLSPGFIHQPPVFEIDTTIVICEGDQYLFDKQELTGPGVYAAMLTSRMGCDSLVRMDLEVQSKIPDTLHAHLFQGETLRMGAYSFSAATEQLLDFTSSHGCDSLIYLILDQYELFIPNAFSPNGDGVNDHFVPSGNAGLLTIHRMQIYDRWGELVLDQSGGENVSWDGRQFSKDAPAGVYLYVIDVTLHDGKKKMLAGDVTLLR